jgi:hypothetical protein
MSACENTGISINYCFPDIRKSIVSGKGKEEFIEDYNFFAINLLCITL